MRKAHAPHKAFAQFAKQNTAHTDSIGQHAGMNAINRTSLEGLSFGELALFARVVELGSLSAVARERDVPTSQVSRALKRVEAAYQLKLINRSTHGLSLTPDGEVFLGYCRELLASASEMESELLGQQGALRGTVRVSISPVLALYSLVPSLKGLAERYPELRVDISVDDKVVDLVRDGVDIAIRTGPVSNDWVVARKLAEHRRALFAAPAYVKRFGLPQHPEELKRHRCIVNAAINALKRWRFMVGGQLVEYTVDAYHRADSTGIILSMVLQGLGIARINTTIAAPMVERGELVPVLAAFNDPTLNPIHAVTLPQRQRAPKIRACVEYWSDWFAQQQALYP
jgi:DNA-binding transcriptional LysR family regulator